MMRTAAFLIMLSATLLAQTTPNLSFRGARRPAHAAVTAGPVDRGVRPGGRTILAVDVTPNLNIHVYAPGAKDFIPITLAIEPQANVKIGKLTYPTSELMTFPGEVAKVPVFQKPFRLMQEVTLVGPLDPGAAIHVKATVNYQACDDKVCYPPESAPVEWTIAVSN
jgi:hypothetical protein